MSRVWPKRRWRSSCGAPRRRSCGYEFGEEVDVQIKALMQSYGEEYPLHLTPRAYAHIYKTSPLRLPLHQAVLNIKDEAKTT